MINFASCFTIGEAHGWRKLSKCGAFRVGEFGIAALGFT
jgi:hypothetical protein